MATPEIGSLTAHSPQESQFVGSSSGVFFINTVRQAFFSSSGEFPPPEDTLVGSESTPHPYAQEETPVSQWQYDPTVAGVLGHAPPQSLARDLMMVYFKVWHPLFPFLHGPTFLNAMELLYSQDQTQTAPRSSLAHNTPWTTIFHASMHSLLCPLTARHNLLTLQALLASQLYLVATMSLRTASTVGGCMLRSMLHAGLHRCPFRYRELSTSSQHRHLRKRIFWSAYALDRYLSQALGLPLGIQDSDIDVCAPGCPELHRPLQHTPSRHHQVQATFTSASQPTTPSAYSVAASEHDKEKEKEKRELPFASYVQSGKITGEALELFHKTIFARSISQTSVLVLTTSVHKWWNSLDLPPPPPPSLQPTSSPRPSALRTIDKSASSRNSNIETDPPFNYTPFFTILYQHLILLINRPSLSLPPNTPEFASSLQSCISAARHILLALKAQRDAGQALFWPGFLSAVWMAGLVLAFACQLGQYVLERGCLEISSSLHFLKIMSSQWEPAKHCHTALSLLLRAVSRLDPDSAAAAAASNFPNATTTTTTTGINSTATNAQNRDTPAGINAGEDSSPPASSSSASAASSGARKRRKLNAGASESLPPRQRTSSERLSEYGAGGVGLGIQGNSLPGNPNGTGPLDDGWSQSQSQSQALELDIDLVDLLQEANFDSLMDLFGHQYPTF
ncbi:hypothetical protein ARAM_002697 [Aspergillus rambellii]|uniref:Xylanolytic transcriptional activator regulatory domain-containing protein n=1 Tax=Aspergillus rambellii TaxID=308745 RepID=A0A0F8TXP6_9EURO|nr:hypothetical protein ARAM_002697 [Aspergillus rambellii]